MSSNESAIHCSVISNKEIIKKFRTDINNGLNKEEIVKRQEEYGKNILAGKKKIRIWSIILNQFKSPLIYILIVAAIISGVAGEIKDTVFIFIVILLNTVLGTQQEWSAERSAISLLDYLKAYASVIRNGKKATINVEELVPGDIVMLKSGDKVPADLRLIKVKNLTIDEAILTGESIPNTKNSMEMTDASTISDCSNIAFTGTQVMTGRATGVVIATGSETEIGKIAETVYTAKDVKPPLIQRMDRFAKQIGLIVLGVSIIMGVIALTQSYSYIEVFLLAAALSVSAIPEGLPIAVTVALSISTNRMAKRNVIVRKLAAVESLGSCTLIASDKTGTLTLNKQTARIIAFEPEKRVNVTGEGYDDRGEIRLGNESEPGNGERQILTEIGKVITIDNEAELDKKENEWVYSGSSIEIAMLSLAYKVGLDPSKIRRKIKIEGEIPFESEKRFSAKFYRDNDTIQIAAKGAPEVIVQMCDKVSTIEGMEKINTKKVKKKAFDLAADGYRVIAVAGGRIKNKDEIDLLEKEGLRDLAFLGLIGFMDPLRADTKESVEKAYKAGVKVVMVTGDNPETAFTIAKELKITDSKEEVVTGAELGGDDAGFEETEDKKFIEKVRASRVFARVSPMKKLNIVEALKKIGNFVAVTGDGVNDAPALKRADIGVAMGSGTDVAKDTASIIVTDDSFSSIVTGIEEGRFAYDNIRKVTYLLISTGLAEVILFIFVLAMQLPMALLPVHLLWLNLVTNGIQDVALAFEKGEPGAMARPPRKPTEGIFNKLMIQETLVSGMSIGTITSIVWIILLRNGMELVNARNILLLLMVLLQNFHVFNCRSERISVFKNPIRRNYILIFGVLAAQGIHIGSMYIPFMQNLLNIEPVTFIYWIVLFAIASAIILIMEIFKIVKRKIGNRNDRSRFNDRG